MGANQLTAVKERVSLLKGKQVNFKINKGRNKIVKFKGVIAEVYPAMFVIKPNEAVDLDRFSYSYFDCLCGDINIAE